MKLKKCSVFKIVKFVLFAKFVEVLIMHSREYCCPTYSKAFKFNQVYNLEAGQHECIDGYVKPKSGTNELTTYFDFELDPIGDTFLMLDSLYVYMKCKVVKTSGATILDTPEVSIVNSVGNTMFKTVETTLNGVQYDPSSSSYTNYKSWIEQMLSNQLQSVPHLRTVGFSPDTATKFEEMTATGGNVGFIERGKWIADSKYFDVIGSINSNLCMADCYLPPGNKLSFKFVKSSDGWLILTKDTTTDYRIQIDSMQLHYRRIRLLPNVFKQVMSVKNQRMLTSKTEIQVFPLAAGLTSYSTNLYRGVRIPHTVVCVLLKSKNFDGSYDTNPLHFPHFNLNRINLTINGKSSPQTRYEPDFPNNLYMREFYNLFKQTGNLKFDQSLCIDYILFKNGQTMMVWDNTPDLCSAQHIHSENVGRVDLEIGMSAQFVF